MSAFEKRPGLKFVMDHVGYRGRECVIWPFTCCTPGYGIFMAHKKMHLAHRYMCHLIHGNPPTSEHHAAHACGNRRCVNPGHLSWKTQSENQLDRREHGTTKKTATKLTRQQANQIWQLRGQETSVVTAAKYGITESNVRQIQNGTIWNPNRKIPLPLSEETVRQIRQLGSKTMREVAEQFNTSQGAVWRIRAGKTFRQY